MENTARLRRQAEFCLRLSQYCPDQPMSRHLSFLAARYHETALQVEFGVPAHGSAQDQDQDQARSFGSEFAASAGMK
jgi:hypothetical protein